MSLGVYGVKINDKHSYTDYGLYLTVVDNPFPDVKQSTVDVPGADGVLDLTGYFGAPRFNNRAVTLTFVFKEDFFDARDKLSVLANDVLGQSVRLIFDDDPDYYHQGRVIGGSWKVNYKTNTITFSVDCEPYKYLVDEGAEPWKWDPFSFETGIIRYYGGITVDGETSVKIVGGWKTVHPTITCDSTMQVRLDDGDTYTINAGVNKVYTITVTRGEHILYITGKGTASLRMQVGSL